MPPSPQADGRLVGASGQSPPAEPLLEPEHRRLRQGLCSRQPLSGRVTCGPAAGSHRETPRPPRGPALAGVLAWGCRLTAVGARGSPAGCRTRGGEEGRASALRPGRRPAGLQGRRTEGQRKTPRFARAQGGGGLFWGNETATSRPGQGCRKSGICGAHGRRGSHHSRWESRASQASPGSQQPRAREPSSPAG